MTDNEKYIEQYFAKANLQLNELQAGRFLMFYERLVEKNKVMNLTGITEFDEVLQKHFVDSVYGLEEFVSKASYILDLGTGAGFPGIPLKILYPETEFVLVDSLQKRLRFLEEVKVELKLDKLSFEHGRAEDLGHDKRYREKFDLVLSRAVANLSSLSEFCLPFTKVGGCFISYKSGACEEEVSSAEKAIGILGGKIEDIRKFMLPESDISRSLIIIRKTKETKKQYPRKAGIPLKTPL
ncbi:MAG: 16S rRNA (guanine(527)-N(7))-methyltransferase RsmG [Lachnospiraceae bacterium]|nr:16S rRNA (guanine(527)-N(7))-methyltransferase RsmG [Lachnospiraceae bacterium]